MPWFRLGGATLLLVLAPGAFSAADEAKKNALDPKALDQQLYETLRDVHNRGADLYNAGDPVGCYRLFQGALPVARAALGHRPAEQKLIDDGLTAAGREPSMSRRAFMLHELIEQVRTNIHPGGKKADTVAPDGKKGPAKMPVGSRQMEPLMVVPREVPAEKKDGSGLRKEPAKSTEIPLGARQDRPKPTRGVAGWVVFRGKSLPQAEVTFVTRGQRELGVYEATTADDGGYHLEDVKPGRYTVLLTASRGPAALFLPTRYATMDRSPLIVDVKPGGDTIDFLLQ